MKKFYFYLKYILEILVLFFPFPSLFCLFPLLGFLLCPPRPSAVRCKSYAHSFGYSLQSHFFEAFAFSVLFASWLLPVLFLTFSFSLSARWPTSSFLHSGWKLLRGRSPLEMLRGGLHQLALHQVCIRAWRLPSPPPPRPGAGHSSLMAFSQYCFSLFLT